MKIELQIFACRETDGEQEKFERGNHGDFIVLGIGMQCIMVLVCDRPLGGGGVQWVLVVICNEPVLV